MNFIVLVKQVPDVAHVPQEAWDREKGTLKRAILDAVTNPLDLQALTFACRIKESCPGSRILCLAMGPHQAREMLEDCLSRGADEAVLLTDTRFSGADTPATAYSLAMAVRKIARDIFHSNDYTIISGMQSVDGDTAQVPPQVAEELGIEHIAYARSFSFDPGGNLLIQRIGPKGFEKIQPLRCPVLITMTNCLAPLCRSFHRARDARFASILEWDADAINADKDRIGFKGSRTWVSRIFSATEERAKPCSYPLNMDELLDRIEADYRQGALKAGHLEARYELGNKTPAYHGEVWVYAETAGGALSGVSLELLGKARELAGSLKVQVGAILVGKDTQKTIACLFAAGADKVYLAEHALLKDFLPCPYTKATSSLVLRYRPQIFLFGATPLGRELAPRIAYATGAGLTADCTALQIDDYKQAGIDRVAILKQSRPALGGNIMATIMTKDSPFQMATVRPGVFSMPSLDHSRQGELIRAEVVLEEKDLGSRIVWVEPAFEKAHLEEADIVVAGGRGMGSRAELEKQLAPLADALSRWLKGKAEVAGSRMAVEDGFIGHDRQVGQTGQTVKPRLYVAVAISGAVQHVTGMQGSGVILSVNRDPHARIFHHSDYGLVGPFEEGLPKLIEAIRRRTK